MLSRNGRASLRRLITAAVLVVAAPGLVGLGAQPASAAPARPRFPDPKTLPRVALTTPRPHPQPRPPAPYRRFSPAGHITLPGGVSATAATTAGWTRAGTTGVSVSQTGDGPHQVHVDTLDQKTATAAGVHGVLFTVRGVDRKGPVGVRVDVAAFRSAFGGDYAGRLRLVELPGCALTSPRLPRCQTQTPIAATTTPLTARVTLASGVGGPAVLAAAADTSGPTGDYTATALSPGGTWSVSGNKGGFTYRYPLTMPAAIGGATPSVSLDYDSSSQDARTEGTNNQSSWVGDGWSTPQSYIERTYRSCDDDKTSGAPAHDGDECWAGQILTLSLNGTSTPIVYDDDTKSFRSAYDDSTIKVEDLTGATNGTKNGEYFRVTQSGVQYYFGLNRLPGWTIGKAETGSAWTVPIYHAHAGVSACPDGSFAATACVLGYRFNLDYVVDPHGNATAYYFAPETGYYGADMKNDAVAYTRGGTLTRIDYGMTATTVYSGTAPEQVVFSTAERCLPDVPAGNDCASDQFSVTHPEYWPDTPIDLNCSAGSTDCTTHGPSYWSRRRLTTITTQIQAGGATWPVDRYDLEQTFPDGGDHAPTLWLESIKHTGLDQLGGDPASITTPATTFNPVQLANRVGTLPSLPHMYYNRIQNIITETGAETTIVYDTPDCSSAPASDPDDPNDEAAQAYASTNTTGCFPVYWTPEAQPRPLMDWFYTHPVTKVTTIDRVNAYQDGTQPKLVTEYAYKGKPAWHYDDNETVKEKNRTWGQFRGYPEVDTTTGDTSVFHYTNGAEVHDQKTLTKTYYFQGMDGDTLPGGDTRSAPALTSQDGTITVPDKDAYAGQVFETDKYTASGGTLDNATVTVPTIIGPTASRQRIGLPAQTAQMVRTARTVTRQAVSYGWRRTETDTFYDTTLGQSTTGMPIQVDDRGEPDASGNVARCTYTHYLDGGATMLVLPAEVITTAQDCSAAGASTSGTLLSDVRTSYDGHAFAYNGDGQTNPARPTLGDATLVQNASAATGATATTFVDETASTYDSYGRTATTVSDPQSKSADASSLAKHVFVRRSPATGEPPTTITTVTQVTSSADCSQATVSTMDCQVESATMDQPRQLATTKIDAAGLVTSLSYDSLGRITQVWQPNVSRSAGQPASTRYSYALSQTAPTVVTTQALRDSSSADAPPTYSTSKTLYDAMLRELETQKTGENDSTTVSDTQYDSHGWKVLTNNEYATAGTPADNLISDSLSQVSVPDTTVTDHDGLGRITEETHEHDGQRTWSTRTAYTGDRTTILPPAGAVATTQTKDARDQLTRLDQYTTAPTLTGNATTGFTAAGGNSQSVTYEFTAGGKEAKVTGPAPENAVWSYTYDLRGRQISHTDPDTGTGLTAYDDAGNVTSTRDARGVQLSYTYDLLHRKLTAIDKSKSNFKLAQWTYDTVRIGKPTSSTRYVNGVTGGYTVATTGYSPLGKPLGTKITLPTSEKPLPAEYTTTFAYTPNTEALAQQVDPAAGGLIDETITYAHDALGAPTQTTGIDLYVSGTTYTDFSAPSRLTLGPSTDQAEVIYAYDAQTLRPTGRTISRSQGIGPVIDAATYTYDDAGNPLSVTDKQSETGNVQTDTQCYQYDGLARLVEAWTADGTCPAADTDPSASTVSTGPGSYWQSFQYDPTGDRTQVTDHGIAGAADAVTTYANGCSTGCNRTGAQPHTLTATSGGIDPAKFVYDVGGNLLSRTPTGASGTAQTLKWDDEGRLAEVDTTGSSPAVTSYLYDADGNQLIRRDPGRTTLFAGDTEIVVNSSISPAATLGAVRTYTHGGSGQAVAVRSSLPGGGSYYTFTGAQGTPTLTMDTTTQAVSRQQYKPYGEVRGSPNTTLWPDPTHGYLGAAQDDSTGYTDLGARKYDPDLGRFISADPLLEGGDPNQLGGYTYAGDNPVTSADPTGLRTDDQYYGPTGAATHEGEDDPVTAGAANQDADDAWIAGKKKGETLGNYRDRHNASRDQARDYLQAAHPKWKFWTEYTIPGASTEEIGFDGRADIVAQDPDTGFYYIWEVKARGGRGAEAAGAEAKGPETLNYYIGWWNYDFPKTKIFKGGPIQTQITQPDPIQPNKRLVTISSTWDHGSPDDPQPPRDSPLYDGVICYWTRGQRDDDELTYQPYASQAGLNASHAEGPPTHTPAAPSQPKGFFDHPFGVPFPIMEPAPPLVPVL